MAVGGALAGFITLLALTMLFTAAPLGAQDPDPNIGGEVTKGGQPVEGVSIDLFTADADGTRLQWLETTVTQLDGSYFFTATPGCYAVTFIAPDNQRFTNNSPWQNTALCLTAGETRTDINAALSGGDGSQIIGAVASGAQPVNGVQVDLFQATADGGRGAYLRSMVTGEGDANGRFAVAVPPGCYVLTLIGGADETWVRNGSRWLNLGGCTTAGGTVDLGTAQLDLGGGGTPKTLAVSVTADGSPIAGVLVDIFDANGDGSRGAYLDSFTTQSQPVTYDLGQATGCRVLTFVAPTGRTFVESGTPWLNRPFCITAEQDVYRFDETIAPAGVTCATGAEFESVFRDDFDTAELQDVWLPYDSLGNAGYGFRRPSAVSVVNGRLVITGAMEDDALVSGGVALELSQTYGRYSFRVRTDEDASQALSGEILTWPTSGQHPRDGENNIYSTLVQTATRTPFYSFIHKPFGSHSDQVWFQHNADAAQFQTMTMEWTPDRISITRTGENGPQDSETFVLDETADDLIPDVGHRLFIQLDAWKHSVAEPVRLEVDWVEVHRYCGN